MIPLERGARDTVSAERGVKGVQIAWKSSMSVEKDELSKSSLSDHAPIESV